MGVLFWLTVWTLSFFMMDIDVEYEDGVKIKLSGWSNPLMNWLKKRKGAGDE